MEKRATISHGQYSLVISPNLDAMLEYSERARRGKEGGGPGLGSPTSPLAGGFPEGGLPPPPRKLQRPLSTMRKSKIADEEYGGAGESQETEADPEHHSTSSNNPYINPVPKFEGSSIQGQGTRLLGKYEEADSSWAMLEGDDVGGDLTPHASTSRAPGPGSPSAGDVYVQRPDRKQPSPVTEASSRPSSPLATFSRVDNLNKLFGKNKTKGKRNSKSSPPPLARRPSTSDGTERGQVQASKLARGLILVRRSKLLMAPGPKNAKSPSVADMYQVESDTPVLDIRRDNLDDRRLGAPCLSHASPSSASSIAPSSPSLYSSLSYHHHLDDNDNDDNDTYTGSDVDDVDEYHRISISSTIYPSSSSRSQHHHSPSTPRPPPIITAPLDRMSSLRNIIGGGHRSVQSASSIPNDSDRESFIDMISPTPQSTAFQPPVEYIAERDSSQTRSVSEESHSNYSMFRKKSRGRSRSPKPPIPTTPKPIFNRPTTPLGISTRLLPSPKPSPVPSPLDVRAVSDGLPSTTNHLNPEERAELIRRSQKLAKMFGQPPGAEALNQQCLAPPSQTLKQRAQHSRGSASISIGEALSPSRERSTPAWPPPEGTQYLSADGRRHSNPADGLPFLEQGTSSNTLDSHDDLSFELDHTIEIGTEEGVPTGEWIQELHQKPKSQDRRIRPDSPTSYIDLSDAEEPPSPDDHDDGLSIIHNKSSIKPGEGDTLGRRRRALSAAQSLYENMSPEEQAEEERRRKREKLAKLHRFLGSRVPANLALGLPGDPTDSLPPITFATNPDISANLVDTAATMPFPSDEVTKRIWMRKRRSSSAAAIPSSWSDSVDRMEENLDDREKAINVKRAQKMERVFGVAPPQTLYHTRHAPSPSLPVAPLHTEIVGSSSDAQPASPKVLTNTKTTPFPYPMPKLRKSARPGTSESTKVLLPKGGDASSMKAGSSVSPLVHPIVRRSQVYTHYQHSLNSLNDIIDRDDKESLAELHEYLHSGDDDLNTSPGPSPTALQEFSRSPIPLKHRLSTASIKSERRRSLPARTSIASITTELTISTISTDSNIQLNNRASMISITSPKPELTDFQLRRRRAAKLTQFFGVNYRELIHDILESIEKGLEDERKRGTLDPEEVEDLLQKLRTLRTKRGQLI